jgi:glycosyltransferase involved in cell wall biosynthesis
LPYELAKRGHEVTVALLSYHDDPPEQITRCGIAWHSESARPLLSKSGLWAYLELAKQLARAKQPDWIIGFSDTWYGILAVRLAKQHGARAIMDAYDNYESYIPWAWPLHQAWRAALVEADLISAAGPELGRLMARDRPMHDFVLVPMAADPCFSPVGNRAAARRLLGLPEYRPLVGYCGALNPNRGLEVLFAAITLLEKDRPGLRLVLSGRHHPRVSVPDSAIQLGYLADDHMPLLVGCLDVLAIPNRDSAFGRHSYPVKLYEAMRCGVSVAVTRTPATEWILADHPEMMAPPGETKSFAAAIARALDNPSPVYGATNDWSTSGAELESVLTEYVGGAA